MHWFHFFLLLYASFIPEITIAFGTSRKTRIQGVIALSSEVLALKSLRDKELKQGRGNLAINHLGRDRGMCYHSPVAFSRPLHYSTHPTCFPSVQTKLSQQEPGVGLHCPSSSPSTYLAALPGPRAWRVNASPVVVDCFSQQAWQSSAFMNTKLTLDIERKKCISWKRVGFLPRHTSMLLCTPAWKQFAGWRASNLSLKELCHMLFSPFTSGGIPYSISFASVSPFELKCGLLTWRIWVNRATLAVKSLANLIFWHEDDCYSIVFIIHQKETFQSKYIKYHIT